MQPVQVNSRFPHPPKRDTDELERVGNAKAPAAPSRTEKHDSDDAEEFIEPPTTVKTEYPDATQTNRRPPMYKAGIYQINVKTESRAFDVCGQYICTGGYNVRVFDMSSGEQITGIGYGETVKATAVAFKPANERQGEGNRIWIGTNAGELQEVDVATHSVISQNSSHNRREIVQILRHQRDLWTLDDDGKLFVWRADESGVPNLKYSHLSHKVQRGHTFSLVALDKLWLATGREIRIYCPGNEATFAALTKPISQTGAGDITSGVFTEDKGGRVYFGHTDGRVTIYSANDYTCIGSVKASDYKINGLTIVGDDLWVAYKTGKIYVYDTTTTPWKVRKDWRAHDGPVLGLVLDGSSVWTMNRLQVTSVGHDGHARFWDGMLEDDWIEDAMHKRDIEYCSFREIRAAVVTWNVGAASPYSLKTDFVADVIRPDDPPELLVFGFQEVVDLEDRTVTAKSILGFGKKKDLDATEQHQSRVYREWRDYLSKIISRYTSAQYTYSELHTSSLIGLFQCIFIRQEERPKLRDVHATNVKCGMKGHYGNKGALVTRFILDDSSLCFINCHLAAGQTQTSHRNNDIATILEAENLPAERDPDTRMSLFVGGGDGSQILDHEICILNGDLNYRIDAIPRDTVINMIRRNDFDKLLERDQLLVSRRRVTGFRLLSFNELPLTFAPTYKYDVGTDNYDSSDKKRAPAWCDRLLYRGPGRVKQVEYRRHEITVSDHRPVSGIFKMRVKTIDAKKRARVKEQCYEQFSAVKKALAEKVSQQYLINELGVGKKEARRLIGGS
jgi:endonuclease/exonuclease/phosphatase family metal-dependent hydrolase